MDEYYKYIDYVLSLDPFVKEDDILKIIKDTPLSLIVIFRDGSRHFIDMTNRGSRILPYIDNNLSRDQFNFEFRIRLNLYMTYKNMSQESLADKIKTTQPNVNRYLSGEVMPSPYMIFKIANALECNIGDLFYKHY